VSNHLLKHSCGIQPEWLEHLEGFLFEEAPSPWVLEVNHLTGEGTLSGFFNCKEDLLNHQKALSDALGHALKLNFSTEVIPNQQWQEVYKKHFKPWNYHHLHLIPLWLKDSYQLPSGDIAVYLDPGMAFGTGNHESTRMCLEFLIEKTEDKSCVDSLVDLGCGSGILSLVAKSIGFKKVWGIDNDPDAVRISHENASLNQLSKSISFTSHNLAQLDKSWDKFNFVIANIQADILISYSKNIMQLAKEDSVIILSGILTKEIDQVTECFKKLTNSYLNHYAFKHMGEWSSIQITLKSKNRDIC